MLPGLPLCLNLHGLPVLDSELLGWIWLTWRSIGYSLRIIRTHFRNQVVREVSTLKKTMQACCSMMVAFRCLCSEPSAMMACSDMPNVLIYGDAHALKLPVIRQLTQRDWPQKVCSKCRVRVCGSGHVPRTTIISCQYVCGTQGPVQTIYDTIQSHHECSLVL